VLYSTYMRASPHGSVTSDAKNLAKSTQISMKILDGNLEPKDCTPTEQVQALLLQEAIHLHDIGIALSHGGKHPLPV